MATAPSAPTLTLPTNGEYYDGFIGTPFQATYNSTDGANQNAYAFRIRTLPQGNTPGTAYQYWNGSLLQDTIYWNSVSTAPGASFGFSYVTNLNGSSYAWSFASQEASGSLQGPFATDFTLVGSAIPTVTVTAPTGTVTTSTPMVTWTEVLAGGRQTYYQVIVETGSFSVSPGSGTQQWNSGLVASTALSAVMGSPTPAGASTRAFVQITQTGGQTSVWEYHDFTGPSSAPSAPTVSAATGTDGGTGCPLIAITITGSSAGTVVITRSDGLYVRNASPVHPATYNGVSLVVNDYEAVPTVAYTYSAQVTGSSTVTSAAGTSGSVTLTTTNWWELNPVTPATAINAQFIDWSPTQIEQSTGHPVMGQNVMNVVASTVLQQDFTGTAELFTAAVYTGFQALLNSGQTVFISSPWGTTDSGYFRIGIPSGGLSTGTGSTTKTTKLMPSTAAGPHRTVDTLAVAAARPPV